MNITVLIGRLVRDPEVALTANGKSYCKFTLAVNRPYKGPNERAQADFINCVAWGATADNLAKYMTKGSQVAVEGSIRTGSYDDKSGRKVYTTDVVVAKIEFLSKVEQNAPQQQTNVYGNVEENQNHFNNQEQANPFDGLDQPMVSNDDLPF